MGAEFDDYHYDYTRPPSDDDYIPKPINTLTLCALLVEIMVSQGWLIKEKKENKVNYYITRKGYEKLETLGVKIQRLFSY